MTPIEHLLAEELPTGQWGGPRHAQQVRTTALSRPTTPLEAAEHVAALEAELDRLDGRGTGNPHRHLQAVPETPAA
ncbi:hypothetical protein [Streptomyces sp. CB02959]|uniref:hypothetical protein n=1 Tax=Streptomyces sp. CB02959 TaxID=2020330 RepID=UPI0011AF66F9|nr:hypothetical protein [Streptomyces sp. CB02959]